jgi:hypothetical protein
MHKIIISPIQQKTLRDFERSGIQIISKSLIDVYIDIINPMAGIILFSCKKRVFCIGIPLYNLPF